MRQVRDGTKIYKYYCATISCDCSGHTVVQCPIFSCRRGSLLTVISRQGIRLITVNYGAGRGDECSSDEVSRDELSPINCRAMKCHGTHYSVYAFTVVVRTCNLQVSLTPGCVLSG